jgi:hypothetical protein
LIEYLKFKDAMDWVSLWGKKIDGNENVKTTIPSTNYDRSETTGECGILQVFG